MTDDARLARAVALSRAQRDCASELVTASVSCAAEAAAAALAPALDRGISLYHRYQDTAAAKAYERDTSALRCREALQEALRGCEMALCQPLCARLSRPQQHSRAEARLFLSLLQGQISKRWQELETDEVQSVTDVKLRGRPLAEITRMLVMALSEESMCGTMAAAVAATDHSGLVYDLAITIIGWLPPTPTQDVYVRFAQQDFVWHRDTGSGSSGSICATNDGWGLLDPREAVSVSLRKPSAGARPPPRRRRRREKLLPKAEMELASTCTTQGNDVGEWPDGRE